MSELVLIYKKFERIWHWSQAFLIFALFFTGLEVHGLFNCFGFEKAVYYHELLAWVWAILILFVFFWIITTGEWKQFMPTQKNLFAVMRYYGYGIFKGEHHPHKKTELSKMNPLQRLTYVAFKLFLIPLQIATGFLYYYFPELADNFFGGRLDMIAILHTFGSYLIISFALIHIYMTTTGHTVFSNVKAMITGYEDLSKDH